MTIPLQCPSILPRESLLPRTLLLSTPSVSHSSHFPAIAAHRCGLEQIEKLHGWDTDTGVKLELHLGLGAGSVRGVDLGNHMRREFVVAGDALKQLSDSEQQAGSGELCVSPEAWRLVSDGCTGHEIPETDFGPGFHVVTHCNRQLKPPPAWRSILEKQLMAVRPVPKQVTL